MPNEIKAKYSSPASLAITLASLASSTGGLSARQSTMVDNSTNKYQRIYLYGKVTVGTTPTANTAIYIWLLKYDAGSSATIATDNAGASDAALTVANARLLRAIPVPVTTSNVTHHFDEVIDDPGPGWGVAVGHDTAVNLNSTAGNHDIRWIGVNPEVQ